jgi:hypothetical protein
MSKYKDKILALRAKGKTYNEIISEIGCARSTVNYYLGNNQASKKASRQRKDRELVKQYIVKYKESKPCADCNMCYPYYVMDFDHLPEFKKSFGIGGTYQSMTRVLKEIAKCEVVCANCHRVRTFKRNESK